MAQNATARDFAKQFLRGIHAPVTESNIDLVIAWGEAESGVAGHSTQTHGGWTNFNPLNVVVQPGDQHVGQGGQQGNIADFGSVKAGAAASARLFSHNQNAAGIIDALRTNAGKNALESGITSFYRTWEPGFGGFNLNTGVAHSGQGAGIGGGGIAGAVTNSVAGPVEAAFGTALGLGGDVFAGLSGPAKLATAFFGLFTNWRYVAEVFVGLGMVGLGTVLVLHDMNVFKAASQRGEQAASVAAVAA